MPAATPSGRVEIRRLQYCCYFPSLREGRKGKEEERKDRDRIRILSCARIPGEKKREEGRRETGVNLHQCLNGEDRTSFDHRSAVPYRFKKERGRVGLGTPYIRRAEACRQELLLPDRSGEEEGGEKKRGRGDGRNDGETKPPSMISNSDWGFYSTARRINFVFVRRRRKGGKKRDGGYTPCVGHEKEGQGWGKATQRWYHLLF